MIARFFDCTVHEYEPVMSGDHISYRKVKSFRCHIRHITGSIERRQFGIIENVDAIMYSHAVPSVGNYIKCGQTVYRVLRVMEIKDASIVRHCESYLEKSDAVKL